MDEKTLYQSIAEEIEANRMDPARWTQAFAEADGDPEKAKAIYIRLRRADLQADRAAAPPPTDPLQRLREALASALALQPHQSLYRTVGASPTSSDPALAEAIRRMREAGTAASAEARYAIEILGDPQARADYDRKLAGRLGLAPFNAAPVIPVADEFVTPDEPRGAFLAWWATRKVSLLVGTAALVLTGYMLNAFYQTSVVRQMQSDAVALEQARIAQQAEQHRAQEDNHQQSAERRAALDAERRARQEKYEQDRLLREAQNQVQRREYEAQAEQRREEREKRELAYAERRRQQEERREADRAERRAAQEAAYWSCFNDAIDRRGSAYAYAACANLKP